MADQSFTLFVSTACITLIAFTLHLLLTRMQQRPVYQPLVIFFVAIAVLLSSPLSKAFMPSLQLTSLVLSLPALLVLPPSLWCYVEGLTHTSKWQFKKSHVKHFFLPLAGLMISITALILPVDLVQAVLTDGGAKALTEANAVLRNLVYGLLLSTFTLILTWVLQSGFYVYAVFKRLATYREQLKQVFASTESKEFYWISWLMLAIGSAWLVFATYLIADNLVSELSFSFVPFRFLLLIVVWSIAIWALRHKPGFEEMYEKTETSVTFDNNQTKVKYQRSALSDEHADAIASKVKQLMTEENAFLDPQLSLQSLAKKANTTPNYLSQTLNEQLNMSFFDYVNLHRIEMAQTLLTTSKQNVLDIALEVGFNSKSSFYSAFKKANGMTPIEFKKQHANS